MKSKKTFVTIFTAAENFHLVKDVGQIPYFMYKTEGYEASLVCYRNNTEYPYLKNEVKGLKLTFIPNNGRLFYFDIGVVIFLFTSSRSIDVLNLFHFKKDNLFYLLVYKLLNKKGKAIIKLDIDLLFFKQYNALFYSKYPIKNYFLRAVTKCIFSLSDRITIETEEGREYLLKIYPELQKKLICIPNGVDDTFIERNIILKPFEQKENIIITVGRIGTKQKNTELLLESLRLTNLEGWKVYIIGPIEAGFKPYIENYFKTNPHLKGKISFTGNIVNRLELFAWYNRAKIFCLTSRFESFGIVFTEALYFGNYILTSPVSSANFITQNGQFGSVVEGGATEFSKMLQESMLPEFLNIQRFERIRSYAVQDFTWPRIVKKLSDNLKNDA